MIRLQTKRGRYRADRPIRVGASTRTSNADAPCLDCRWIGDRVADGRHVDAYMALLLRHFAAAHGGTP